MNQDFKLRFDQMRSNKPAEPVSESSIPSGDASGVLHGESHPKNLCLVWPNGKQSFFNYAYLVGADFNPEGELNVIQLNYTACQVTVKGYGLDMLYAQLADHLPRIIVVTDLRYIPENASDEGVVVEILVETRE
jgi:hypothetical protein